jgi:hypothetical protein
MSALRAMAVGARRALGSPFILLWLWVLNIAVAAPVAWVVVASLEDGIGASRAYVTLSESFDMEWYRTYRDEARGIASTFTPTHTGAGALYENLERMVTGDLMTRSLGLTVIGGVYALLWLLMLGGAIDRFADRVTRSGFRRFFGAGGRFFFRFVRLAVLSGALYFAIYWVSRHVLDWMEAATRDVNVEGTIFYYSLLIWGFTAVLLTLIHACFGFAKVATVVDDRRSMLLAAMRGFVFVVRHPARTLGLYYGFLLVTGFVLAGYVLLAPGVGQQNYEALLWAFAGSQIFLLLRLFVRLSLLGGQTALYQAYALPPAEPQGLSTLPEPVSVER